MRQIPVITRHVLDAASIAAITGRTDSSTAALADLGAVSAPAADLDDADAVERLRPNLAVKLAPHGIRVNAVAPAIVRIPIHEELISEADLDSAPDGFAQLIDGTSHHRQRRGR
ncbi:hypothetical protein [Streptomyces sp. NPDC059787]|uniref:hypothetical protein n=1 Tax=Streptomyces sp. NPDC059787 TaxID=3346947 RepID=UPI0036659452